MTPVAVQVNAQAKINLWLRILAREHSGYHQLETAFLRIALADNVRVRRTPRDRTLDITGDVDLRAIGPTEKNLAWRAAVAHADHVAWKGGFAIEIEKHIPIGGGLGGGSADAGGVLRAMNAMAPSSVNVTTIACALGADVPFLATECTCALAWGRGERMLAVESPPVRDAVLVVPPFGVNTAEAFRWVDELPARTPEAVLHGARELGDWARIAARSQNDFEEPVIARHAEMQDIWPALAGPETVLTRMSGSGSTVFGIFGTAAGADRAVERFAGTAMTVIRTRTAAHVEPVEIIE